MPQILIVAQNHGINEYLIVLLLIMLQHGESAGIILNNLASVNSLRLSEILYNLV